MHIGTASFVAQRQTFRARAQRSQRSGTGRASHRQADRHRQTSGKSIQFLVESTRALLPLVVVVVSSFKTVVGSVSGPYRLTGLPDYFVSEKKKKKRKWSQKKKL
jgi:ABC-type Fe3+ transport system permease subunit